MLVVERVTFALEKSLCRLRKQKFIPIPVLQTLLEHRIEVNDCENFSDTQAVYRTKRGDSSLVELLSKLLFCIK